MNFLNPEYLWLFLFLLAAFMKNDFKNLRLTSYGYIVTFVFIVLALTRPVIEQEPVKTQEVLSDVVIGVDLSFSMQAIDISPTRLSFAKEALKELVMRDTKSRFGVFGFTTNAIILSPLTEDSELLLHLFNALDETLIMTKGSSIMPALRLARKMSASKSVSLVLLTDGADELNYSQEAKFAKENNIIVNILMIATKIGAPLRLADGNLLEDELGDIVVSRENSTISLLADATGGVYSKSMSDIQSALSSQSNAEYKSNVTVVQNIELFYYFVALALLAFIVSTTTLKKYVLGLLLLLGINLNADSLEFFKNKNAVVFSKAVSFYEEGEYEKSLQMFQSVLSSKAEVKSVVYYNQGNSLVRLKEFKKAREAYTKSLVLFYSKEADENLQHIKNVKEQQDMTTGQQKSAKKSELAKKRESSQKQNRGGSSNMKVSTASSGGEKNEGKKSKQNARVDLNAGKAKLSSRQYELINKRQVDEKQPW